MHRNQRSDSILTAATTTSATRKFDHHHHHHHNNPSSTTNIPSRLVYPKHDRAARSLDNLSNIPLSARPSTAPSNSQLQQPHSLQGAKSPSPTSKVPRISFSGSNTPSTRSRQVSSASITKSDFSDLTSRTRIRSSSILSRPAAITTSTVPPPSEAEPRSPTIKRPPASWSSHGIETSHGPPPSLITRGSYHSDVSRRAQNSIPPQHQQKPHLSQPDRTSSRPGSAGASKPKLSTPTYNWPQSPMQSSPLSPKGGTSDYIQSLNAMIDRSRQRVSGYSDDDITGSGPNSQGFDGAMDHDDTLDASGDLFLRLAQDGSDKKEASPHLPERRTSRGRSNKPQLSSQTISSRPRRDSSSHDSGYATRSAAPAAESSVRDHRRPSAVLSTFSTSKNPTTMSADQRFSAYRSRYMASNAQSSSPSVVSYPVRETGSSYSHRRPSVPDPISALARPPVYRPSRLNNTATREFDVMSNTGSPSEYRRTASLRVDPRAEVAESVISAAPSTVWDELHELKSRIQKIELADKPSSGGTGTATMSIGSGERPRTATTGVTTMSSSPKVSLKPGQSPSDVAANTANLHPVLRQSLARSKTLLSPALYRSLEAMTNEALEMCVLASNMNTQGNNYSDSPANNGVVTDRHLRRKADNVCRNLADLCIALCDGKLDAPAPPPAPTTVVSPTEVPTRNSREVTPAPPPAPSVTTPLTTRDPPSSLPRHISVDPETPDNSARSAPSRALDRVEARRVSMLATHSLTNSPREVPLVTTTPANNRLQEYNTPASAPAGLAAQQILSKTPRTGTALLRTRRRAQAFEDDEDDTTLRAPSRAVTEVGGLRKRSMRVAPTGTVAAREYTSQHSMPGNGGSNNNSPGSLLPGPRRAGTTGLGLSMKAETGRSGKFLEKPVELLGNGEEVGDLRRRSLGLYTSGARSSLATGRRGSFSKKARSMLVAGSGSGGTGGGSGE
ncbi:hypothetical protein EJ06DRAFT_546760 [Trichodelitschia bisporula]|uniref:Uncharacterized protein n=1 Tax=Trichodelitschia bisporula TaxID=703511 RepID=A0A6G1I5V1_9PEZI|nr:hypothetical protein EJ06DRAFT_546760 [Trichodelitschia bisporula]